MAFLGIAVLPTSSGFASSILSWWQYPRRLRTQWCFSVSCELSASSLAPAGSPPWHRGSRKRGLCRQRLPAGNPYLKHHFSVLLLIFMLCHWHAPTYFHFLSTFWPCLFVYLSFDFFFSWFHWWIWSISSLPCQWKTHQPFVQADIPVSIISCAKRPCMPLSLMAQGCHRFGFVPLGRLISPAGFSGMEGMNKWTPEGWNYCLLDLWTAINWALTYTSMQFWSLTTPLSSSDNLLMVAPQNLTLSWVQGLPVPACRELIGYKANAQVN